MVTRGAGTGTGVGNTEAKEMKGRKWEQVEKGGNKLEANWS